MVDDQQPVMRVVRGDPTPEELAALVAVLLRRSREAAASEPPVSASSAWVRISRPGATVGARPATRGVHAWRCSAFPR